MQIIASHTFLIERHALTLSFPHSTYFGPSTTVTDTFRPSATVEDYLKALYSLEQRGHNKVRIKDMAELMDVSLPSVTTMMKSLAEQDFVERTAYRGVCLTEDGKLAALKVIRKHRLVEAFLIEVLGYTWDEVHEEAERLEHAMSDTLTDRIDQYLGFPRFDPHGDPIPSADGTIEKPTTQTLIEAPQQRLLSVQRVTDQSTEVLQYLGERGIQPGATLSIERVDPFDGPIWIKLDDQEIVLSRTLAHRVLVDQPNARTRKA